MDDIWWDKWQSMDSNPGDPWSMVVQDEFGVDSVEMIWQRLPNISKHPVSRCGRTPRQPHSTHSTHSIPVTVRFCDVLRCCFARVSAQNFHPPGSKSKTDSEDTIFLLRSAFVVFETLSSLVFCSSWIYGNCCAGRWNQSFECQAEIWPLSNGAGECDCGRPCGDNGIDADIEVIDDDRQWSRRWVESAEIRRLIMSMSGGDEVKERERERAWYRRQDPVPCFASFCYVLLRFAYLWSAVGILRYRKGWD